MLARVDDFWHEYFDNESTGPPLTADMVQAAEQTLGHKLPESYLRLLRSRNGGYPHPSRSCFAAPADSGIEDPLPIETIRGLGYQNGVDGLLRLKLRNRNCMEPELIIIADTPTGGHDFFVLDYRQCAPDGEPRVSHVETEGAVSILVLAPDFDTFCRGLVKCPEYDEEQHDDNKNSVDNRRQAGRPWWRFW